MDCELIKIIMSFCVAHAPNCTYKTFPIYIIMMITVYRFKINFTTTPGGSVVTRSGRTASDIPAYAEKEFRATAVQFGFNYDTMCISNVTNCSD